MRSRTNKKKLAEMNSTYEYGILLTKAGEWQNPINFNAFIAVAKILCTLVGFTLNVLITVIIISLRSLRNEPRNIFTGLSRVSTESVCQKYFLVVGLATLCRSDVNMLLALAEKYIAIKFPLWQGVTVRFVVGVCSSSSVS